MIDYVKCNWCDTEQMVVAGEDICPACGAIGCLMDNSDNEKSIRSTLSKVQPHLWCVVDSSGMEEECTCCGKHEYLLSEQSNFNIEYIIDTSKNSYLSEINKRFSTNETFVRFYKLRSNPGSPVFIELCTK